MEAFTNIEVDLTIPRPYGPWVYAVQGDGNTRRITVSLLSGQRPWNVPEGAEVALQYQHQNGAKGLYNLLPDGTPAICVQGNRVTVTLAAPLLCEPGEVCAAIVINNWALDQLTTFPFTIVVKPNTFALGQKAEDYIRLEWLESRLNECMTWAKGSGLFDGAKGDPFTYDDFTPEQLAALTGPQGPAGDNSAAIQAADAANAAAVSANNAAAAAQAAADGIASEVSQLRGEIAQKQPAGDYALKSEIYHPNSEYELIEEITVEDGVTVIERTKEPDGTDYNFKKMYIRVGDDSNSNAIGVSSSGFLIRANYSYGTSPDLYSICYVVGTSVEAEAEIIADGFVTIRMVGRTENYRGMSQMEKHSRGLNDLNKNIRKIGLGHYEGITAGTVIKIWGVRADA